MAHRPDMGFAKKFALVLPIFAVVGFLGIRLQIAAALLAVGGISLLLLVVLSRSFGFAPAVEIIGYILAMYGLLKLVDSVLHIIHSWRAGAGWRALFKPRH